MLNIIPDDADSFQTEGEKRFYLFLREATRASTKYLSWYAPDISGREPDFILFSKDVGLVVLEVKDWSLDQIVTADGHSFLLNIGGKQEQRKNPLFQAREYFTLIMSKIKADGRLLSTDPQFYGKPRIPVTYGVAFPNINKHEFLEKGLDPIIPARKVFFADDIHPLSEICSDSSGHTFSETLKWMFPPIFNFTATNRDIQILRHIIFPVVRIEVPSRGGVENLQMEKKQLQQLDHNQECVARKMGSGLHVVTGPSGCGKTLVLIHRAAMLLMHDARVNRILFVCFNITLANYIQRMLANKRIPLGSSGVDVIPFYPLCAKIVGEKVPNEGQDGDYYDLVVQEALESARDQEVKYDAILVDEGQDFSADMINVLRSLLSPGSTNMMIAMDAGQCLYHGKGGWLNSLASKECKIHDLKWAYRNSLHIGELAARFRQKSTNAHDSEKEALSSVEIVSFKGGTPSMPRKKDIEGILKYTIKTVSNWLDQGYPASEIAVLYTTSRAKTLHSIDVPGTLIEEFTKAGILSQWTSRDANTKENYDITTEKVTISTIHSVKGLDYACVVLLGVDLLDTTRVSKEHADNLVYVAMTRARMELVIPWVEKTRVVESLINALKN